MILVRRSVEHRKQRLVYAGVICHFGFPPLHNNDEIEHIRHAGLVPGFHAPSCTQNI
jgi:hypothetical protein